MTYDEMGTLEGDFVQKCMKELWKDGYTIQFVGLPNLNGASGWFDAELQQFVVCVQNDYFFEVFLHEYNHYQQWKEDIKYWKRVEQELSYFWKMTSRNAPPTKPYSIKRLRKAALAVIKLEMDCEMRAVKMIQEYGFSIDVEEYRKASNAYFWVYGFAVELGKWITKPIYGIKGLVEKMGTEYLEPENYLNTSTLPKSIQKIYYRKFV